MAKTEDIFVSYTIKNLPKSPFILAYRDAGPFDNLNLSPTQIVMNHSLLALSKIYFGSQTRERPILDDGLSLYGQAMGMLNSVLARHHSPVTTETILAVIALGLSEVSTVSLQSFHFSKP